MKKLFFAMMLTIITVVAAHALDTGYETFEDLDSAVDNEQANTSGSQFGNIIMNTIEAQNPANHDDPFLNEFNPKQGRVAAMQEISALKKYLKFNTDKVENITWVGSRVMQFNPYMEIYTGERDGKIWLRLRVQASDTTLLDVAQIVLNIDGEIHRIETDPQYRTISSRVSTSREMRRIVTRIWYTEKIDMPVSDSLQIMNILRQIPSSGNAVVRLRGHNGSVDFSMSSASKNALSDVIRYYNARRTELQ